MLEPFHGAFDSGKLDRILSESMLVGFEAPSSSQSVLVMLDGGPCLCLLIYRLN